MRRKNIVNINLTPANIDHRQPGIYIHYYEGKVQYVGETVNVWDGRPFRASHNKPVDKIRWLRAPQDNLSRKKWEAYLVCKLKPTRQNVRQYEDLAKRAGYVLSQKEMKRRFKEDQIKFTRKIIKNLRKILHEYSISQKGYVPLNKYEIHQKCKYAYYDSISITNKIMNNEDKMAKWHNDVLFNYCIKKRREIENSLFGPLQ
jgi:hypothetical protein